MRLPCGSSQHLTLTEAGLAAAVGLGAARRVGAAGRVTGGTLGVGVGLLGGFRILMQEDNLLRPEPKPSIGGATVPVAMVVLTSLPTYEPAYDSSIHKAHHSIVAFLKKFRQLADGRAVGHGKSRQAEQQLGVGCWLGDALDRVGHRRAPRNGLEPAACRRRLEGESRREELIRRGLGCKKEVPEKSGRGGCSSAG